MSHFGKGLSPMRSKEAGTLIFCSFLSCSFAFCSERNFDDGIEKICQGQPEGFDSLKRYRRDTVAQLLRVINASASHSTRMLAVKSLGELRCDDAIVPLISMLRKLPKFRHIDSLKVEEVDSDEQIQSAIEFALSSIGSRSCRDEVLMSLSMYEESVSGETGDGGVVTIKIRDGFNAVTKFRSRLLRVLVNMEGPELAMELVRVRLRAEERLGNNANKLVIGNLKEAEKELIGMALTNPKDKSE